MPLLSRFTTFVMLLGALLAAPEAAGSGGVRLDPGPLIAGAPDRRRRPARRPVLAGIQIELDAGFKTYWRSPGEAGLPPAFDWARSVNVGGVEVLWPAPSRFEDAGRRRLRLWGAASCSPSGSARQIRQSRSRSPLKLDYGVCKDICIPAGARAAVEAAEERRAGPALRSRRRLGPHPEPAAARAPRARCPSSAPRRRARTASLASR